MDADGVAMFRRFIRGTCFRGLWIVPLLIAVGLVLLWGRCTFGFSDTFWFTASSRWQHRVESEAGAIWLKWNYRHIPSVPPKRGFATYVTAPNGPWSGARTIRSASHYGFLYVGYRNRPGDYGWFAVPHLHAITACVLLTGAGLLIDHRWGRRRPRPGLCPACGYDLRGSPGDPCPECGAARPTDGRGGGGQSNVKHFCHWLYAMSALCPPHVRPDTTRPKRAPSSGG